MNSPRSFATTTPALMLLITALRIWVWPASASAACLCAVVSTTVAIRLSTEPSTFDPGQQQWDYEAAVGRQTFEALLRPTRDFRDVAGAAADSYTVDSTGTVYRFRLHPGAR